MIDKVYGKNIKGKVFEYDLKKLNFVVGPNSSGKSAISCALFLTILGMVPGKGKTNQFILDTFGNGKMEAGIKIDKLELFRQFVRSDKGTVSQKYFMDNGKVKKDDWVAALARAGNPKILDLTAFMDMSDQGKIELIFELFPPDGDVIELTESIQKQNDVLNSLRSEVHNCENLISKLSKAKAQIEMPPGTMAETTGQIEKLTNDLDSAKQALADLLAKEKAEEEARKKAEAEAELKRIAEQEAKAEAENQLENEKALHESLEKDESESFFPEIDENNGEMAASDEPGSTFEPTGVGEQGWICEHDPFESIEKIISTIESVACPICSKGAAIMVAKNELKKYMQIRKL